MAKPISGFLAFLLVFPASCLPEKPPVPEPFELEAIPRRPAGAMTGSELARRTADLSGPERQRAAVAELLSGNVPGFLRHLVPVRLVRELEPDRISEAWVWVSADYLAIGSDEDFLRIPLTYPSATTVASRFGCVLPTTRVVDAVFEQAGYHLKPDPLPPGPRMRSSEYYLRHRQLIERQLVGLPHGTLVAGHKKDVVLTLRLATRPDRVAIYGWHRRNGEPIQPLSTVHGERYADYSHGVRLVWEYVLLDGERRSIYELLADPDLAPLFSDEGRICSAWRLMHPDGKKVRPKDLLSCG